MYICIFTPAKPFDKILQSWSPAAASRWWKLVQVPNEDDVQATERQIRHIPCKAKVPVDAVQQLRRHEAQLVHH